METLIVSVIVAVVTGAGAALITSRYRFKTDVLAEFHKRLGLVETKEEKCQEELFELRTDTQTVELMVDILLQHCPDADDEILKVRERMIGRRKARGDDPHKTKAN